MFSTLGNGPVFRRASVGKFGPAMPRFLYRNGMMMTFLSRVLIGVFLAALVATAGAQASSKDYHGDKPAAFRMIKPWKMPAIAFVNGKGEKVRLADFKGKVVLLHFWASWCHVCKVETPTVNSLAGRLKHKNFVVVALSVDRTMAAAKRYLESNKYTNLAVHFDEGMKSLRAIGVEGTPTTFLINKQGDMVGFVEGIAGWNSDEAVTLINHFINE